MTESVLDDLDGGLVVSPTDIGERLWHFFISMRTGLVLILGLAVLGFFGTMLMQAHDGLKSDPQAYATWLESLRPKYGGWTGILDTLGLFSIFSSVWFRGIFRFSLHPELMAAAPIGFQLHALAAFALFALWPFTRLVHVFSAPLGYLTRPYIVYRSRDDQLGSRKPRRGWEKVK